MLTLQEIHARKKEASGQVSTQTRSLALGFLAISWALLTVHDEPLRTMAANVNRNLVLALAAGAVLVLAFDLLQYVSIVSMNNQAAELAEKSEAQTAQYDKKWFVYRAQAVLYFTKFGTLLLTSILLIVIFILLFLPRQAPTLAVVPPAPACIPMCAPTAPAATATPGVSTTIPRRHARRTRHSRAPGSGQKSRNGLICFAPDFFGSP
jgi:hypothetical protein